MDNGISIVDYPTQVGMITRTIKVKAMKDRALELLEQIEANVSVCCAITMEPEEVLELIDELREIINGDEE
jgi:3-deoxy-D-arabino-heptulosonate 7-phosphate (DAHP) synthase class II